MRLKLINYLSILFTKKACIQQDLFYTFKKLKSLKSARNY